MKYELKVAPAGRAGSVESEAARPEPLTVLCLIGWGRSGSTIIENILGQIDGFFTVGELHYLWSRSLPKGWLCGCGASIRDCGVWKDVLEQVHRSTGLGEESIAALQDACARLRHTPRLLLRSGRGSWRAREAAYAEVLGATYEALARRVGARVIVDSSKRPSHAALLELVPGISPRYVHLVRDPRAVAFSWRRPKKAFKGRGVLEPRSPWNSTANWLLWNLGAESVRWRAGRRLLRIRYEDFAADPRTVITNLVSFAGERPTALPVADSRMALLGPTHTVSGNPSRFERGRVMIREDDEWRLRQGTYDRAVATAVGLPLLRRYGYRVR